MIEHALVRDGQIVRHEMFSENAPAPVLAANKGAWLPVVTEDPAFNPITQVRGETEVVVEEGRVLITAAVRDKTDAEIAAMRAAKITAIKAAAGERILALYPAWKQTNMLARGFELTYRRFAGELTPEEDAEVAALQAAWDAVKALRETSDALEASVPSDAIGIDAFDTTEGWD